MARPVRRRLAVVAVAAWMAASACPSTSELPPGPSSESATGSPVGDGTTTPASTTPASITAASPGPPSDIVLILTDDQRWDTLWVMPEVRSRLAAKGIEFTNAFASNPLCCPSRATILTGTYSHTNGLYRNEPPAGGFDWFNDSTTVATQLHDAGYRTGLFGKYLNGYTEEDTTYVPPGWDRWFAFTDRNGNGSYYDNVFSVDGQPMGTGSGPEDYSTDVLAREAVSFIQGTPAETPLFVYLSVKAPHERATPAPGDEDLFGSLRPFRPPSFNEADVSDKPEYVRGDDPLTTAEIELADELRTNALRTLVGVDRAVGTLLDALEAAGRMESTLVVFASDNGYLFGEHRRTGKGVPYEESIRIPMVVRFDALDIEPRAERRLVTNVDLTPTFLDAAGVPPPPMDGMSLLPIMASADASWRQDFLVEHQGEEAAYCGVRTEQEIFVVYGTGEEELYDLVGDQFELQNVAAAPEFADVRASLEERLRALCAPPPLGVSPP